MKFCLFGDCGLELLIVINMIWVYIDLSIYLYIIYVFMLLIVGWLLSWCCLSLKSLVVSQLFLDLRCRKGSCLVLNFAAGREVTRKTLRNVLEDI